MLNAAFKTPLSLLHQSHELRPVSSDDSGLRVRYLAFMLAATAAVVVLTIVASIGVRLW